MDYDLRYVDLEDRTLQSLDNPFRPVFASFIDKQSQDRRSVARRWFSTASIRAVTFVGLTSLLELFWC
jgi:hypothetical protein